MVNTVIIEDELKSRTILQTLIEKYTKNITITGIADSVKTGIELIEYKKPDLVLLDISMPDGSGFNLLENVLYNEFETIFITAHSEHAIQAIKSQALDYLLKPINILELQLAVNKAIQKVHSKENHIHLKEQLKHALSASTHDKIAIPTLTGHIFVEKKQIIFLVAKGGYTEIVCLNNITHLSCQSLKKHLALLPKNSFFRVHHSYIINVKYVKAFHKGDGSYIVMSNNIEIPIARRKKRDFLNLFNV